MQRKNFASTAFAGAAFLAAAFPAVFFGEDFAYSSMEKIIWTLCPFLVAIGAWIGARRFVMKKTPGSAAWRGALVGLALLQVCVAGLSILDQGLGSWRRLLAMWWMGNVFCAIYCAVLAAIAGYLCRRFLSEHQPHTA